MAILDLYGKGGGAYLEPGNYKVHIFDIKDNERTAKPSIDIYFKCEQGMVKDMFSLTEASAWRIANLAMAAGCYKDKNDPKSKNFNTQDLIGHEVMVQVIKDDKGYSGVKAFWPVDPEAERLIEGLKKNPGPYKSNPALENEPPDDEGDNLF